MIEVAIPDTSLINCTGVRDKTQKVGLIARALAIFRVEHVVVYSTGRLTSRHQRDPELIVRLLRYMNTPQYLRKRAFSRSPMLQFAGTLPPLRTRSHPLAVSIDDLRPRDVRWGIQVRPGKVDIGLDRPVDFDSPVDQRRPTLFRIVTTKPKVNIERISPQSVDVYLGYEVDRADDLITYLRQSEIRPRVALSRNGTPFKSIETTLQSLVQATGNLIALFGDPHHGVSEILLDGSSSLKDEIDLWVNSIPGQGTETVRLEEAILISLGLLNNSIGDAVAPRGYF